VSARRALAALILPLLCLGAGTPTEPPKPEIVDLGNGHYRVGPVEIDKTANEFTVPGRVLRAEPPLEFLAVAKGGRKGYESMLELDATAFEFNLACILIGLDGERTRGRPGFHFDPQLIEGDGVAIEVSWDSGGTTQTHAAGSLVLDGGHPIDDGWVYTGSEFTRNGAYLAHIDGTLIGLVHDPSSVIEHASGVGINTYGSIKPADGAPAAETRVSVRVRRIVAEEAEPAGEEPDEEDAP
jgi:hypothetical protein